MTLDSSSSIERSNLVMMSATKHLGPANEILRCAQDDNLLPILLVNLHYRPHRQSVNVLLEEERPSQGRPQGSHPLILTTPAHTRLCWRMKQILQPISSPPERAVVTVVIADEWPVKREEAGRLT